MWLKQSEINILTLSRPGGTLCPLTKITEYLQNDWEFRVKLRDFYVWYLSIQKFSVSPINSQLCCHRNHTTFSIILKTRISVVFRVFAPERNFLWVDFPYFGHHNALGSVIEAHVRCVTVERFQKIILPKYGHQQ